MGIQEDINQSKFRNEYQKAAINLIYTFNWVTEQTKNLFEKHGLTAQQFNILRILRGAGEPLSTLQIRQRMLDKMSDTSRIVDRLILKGLAQKSTSSVDHRLVDVLITEKGLDILREIDEGPDIVSDVMNNVTEEEMEELSQLLDKIRASN